MERIKVLITVKTYPIPSAKYDELVCTAGVREDGSFVRLYPINFRDLDFSKQYRKYQWIEVAAEKHRGRDARKESYRPDCDSIRILGELIAPKGDWSARAKYALVNKSQSMEELQEQQKRDRTSLGVFKPKRIRDVIITPDDPDWKASFKAELVQARLFETRKTSKVPPRKVPFRFQYRFECEDPRCKGDHRMMIEDWELGALFWRLVDRGDTVAKAAEKVKQKYLVELCGPDVDTHLFVGTVLAHQTWVVIGVWYPKVHPARRKTKVEPTLFD